MTQTIERSDDPAAWTPAEIGGKEGLIHRLGDEQREAIDAMLAATQALPIDELSPAAFASPALAALMQAVKFQAVRGRGATVLSGFDLGERSLDEYERVYRYLGSHLGRLVPQSGKGDLIGRVRHATDSKARGYLTDMELGPHTDYHEILSLASYRKADKGGLSGLTSALAVHDEMVETHRDDLALLYEGYYSGIPIRYGVDDNPLSARKVPVFSRAGGKVSAFTLSFWHDAAHRRGETLPPDLLAATRSMVAIASRDDMQIRFMLEPGEMLFWNNRTVFHSRTRFENLPGQERMLLRLWIELDQARPVHATVAASAELVERFHEQGLEQRESAVSY